MVTEGGIRDAKRAARRDRPRGHAVGIAAFAHLRDAHLADRGTGCRAADPDIAANSAQAPRFEITRPPGTRVNHRSKRLVQVSACARGGDGRAHDDEHRDRQKGKVIQLAEQNFGQQLQRPHAIERSIIKPVETISSPRPTETPEKSKTRMVQTATTAPSVSGSITRPPGRKASQFSKGWQPDLR